MKTATMTIFTILLFALTASAGVIQDGSITVSATAQGIADGLGVAISQEANGGLIRVETDDVRIGFKTAPTATTGIQLGDNDSVAIGNNKDLNSFRVILDSGATSATVHFIIWD